MNHETTALELWNQGYNCAQSVLGAYSGVLGLGSQELMNLGRGFGAGLARQGEVCGAVSGALMVLSLGNPRGEDTEGAHKETIYRKVKEFSQKFKATQGSLTCRDLLGCDLSTPGGQAKFSQEGLRDRVCQACVTRAAALVQAYLPG